MSDPPIVFEGYRRRPHPLAKLERWIFRASLGGTLEPVRVERKGDGWSVDGEPLPSDRIESGYLEAMPAGAKPSGLRLCLFDREHERLLDLVVHEEAQGRQLLESLGLDPRHRAMTFVGTHLPLALLATVLFFFGLSLALTLPAPWLWRWSVGFTTVIIGAVAMRYARYPIVVSTAGIALERWGKHRYIAFANVREANAIGEHQLELALVTNETVTLTLPATGIVGDMSLPFGWAIRGDLVPTKHNPGGGTLSTPNHFVARLAQSTGQTAAAEDA